MKTAMKKLPRKSSFYKKIAAATKNRAFHVLRPIPQTQLDAMNDPNKSSYQNPGY